VRSRGHPNDCRCSKCDGRIDLTLPELKRRERPFEYALRDELKRRDIMFVKCKPTIEGFPDRLAIGHGRTRLVECKRKDGELSETQVIVHRDIARRGVRILVVEGPDVKRAADIIELRLRRGS
jgi:hypothetical protein